MSISTKEPIIYSELIDKLMDTIKTLCVNIDELSPEVPNTLKYGYSFSKSIQFGVGSGSGYWVATATANYTNQDDTSTKIVTSEEAEESLRTFLINKGVAEGDGDIIYTKGLLNILTCASEYIRTHVIAVQNNETPSAYNFLFPSGYSNSESTQLEFSDYSSMSNDEYIPTNLEEFESTLNNVNKLHYSQFSVTLSCCSSSSSSSSSSCSSSSSSSCSSSSSSSSVFIAFMRI